MRNPPSQAIASTRAWGRASVYEMPGTQQAIRQIVRGWDPRALTPLRTRRHHRRRRDIPVATLRRYAPGLRLDGVAAGLRLLLELAPDADDYEVIAAAARRSVGVYGVRAHRARPPGPPALLLGYGNLSNTAIVEGVKRLASVRL
jgi:DNA-binding transcriptional MocR family regulator